MSQCQFLLKAPRSWRQRSAGSGGTELAAATYVLHRVALGLPNCCLQHLTTLLHQHASITRESEDRGDAQRTPLAVGGVGRQARGV